MKYFIFFIWLTIQCTWARTDEQEAMRQVQKAILTYPQVKGYVKTAERTMFEYLPISREHAGAFGSVAMTLVSGSINTQKLKNFSTDFYGGRIRPDIVYNLKTREAATLVLMNWSW